MKKLLALTLAAILLFAFAACGKKTSTDAGNAPALAEDGYTILLEKGEDMKNTYSLIACNPEKLDDINTEGANAFIEWMTSPEAGALIAGYGKEQYGQALFYLIDEAYAQDGESEETAEAPENSVIRISTTTSVNDSGLLPYLLPTFEAKTGYTVEIQSAGTGAAIQKAKDGNADLILVHAKASEEEFISEGYGVERIPFMYNYFVIVGPESDPAGIAGCENAAEAFAKIADSKSTFISRGDDSGTHKAEIKIWGENAPDAEADTWYISAGQGMGACLTMAKQMNGYCLTDKATFLSMAE